MKFDFPTSNANIFGGILCCMSCIGMLNPFTCVQRTTIKALVCFILIDCIGFPASILVFVLTWNEKESMLMKNKIALSIIILSWLHCTFSEPEPIHIRNEGKTSRTQSYHTGNNIQHWPAAIIHPSLFSGPPEFVLVIPVHVAVLLFSITWTTITSKGFENCSGLFNFTLSQ